MISVFNDYCSDHLSNRDEEIDMEYHWQIEDQRLTAERNQKLCKKYWLVFIFTFTIYLIQKYKSRYFYIGRFIELIKERYPNITKLIICFDPRKPVDKTNINQL
jgi:hypothetical protein